MWSKNEIIQETNEEVFDYGIVCGYKDAHRLLSDETADIYVTFIHSSIEEFFGAFYFVQALCEGENVDSLFGTDCRDPVFLTTPLFLHFSLWLLNSDQRYFTFANKELTRDALVRYCSEKLQVLN